MRKVLTVALSLSALAMFGPFASVSKAAVNGGCPASFQLATIDQATDVLFPLVVTGASKEEVRAGIASSDRNADNLVCYRIGKHVIRPKGGFFILVIDNAAAVAN